MKWTKWFSMSAIIMLVGAVVIMQPVGAAAFNPQPEPPGEVHRSATRRSETRRDSIRYSTVPVQT